jgi:hypothetical protein
MRVNVHKKPILFGGQRASVRHRNGRTRIESKRTRSRELPGRYTDVANG